MGTINYTVPVAGSTLNSVADPEISTALQTLLTWANGNVDAVNLSALLAQSAAVNQSGQTVKGAVNISTAQSTSSTTFTTLATPDQVTGITLSTNGLIRVRYQAMWEESSPGSAQAAIFIGSNQLKVGEAGGTPVVQSAMTSGGTVNTYSMLASCPVGLVSHTGAGVAYTGDVTTGQALGQFTHVALGMYASFGASGAVNLQPGGPGGGAGIYFGLGGPCEIQGLPAGTYTISVQFLTAAGTVTVQNRKLWVDAISFG